MNEYDDNEKKDLTEQVEDSKISFDKLAARNVKSSRLDKFTTVILLLICVALCAYLILGHTPSREIALPAADTATNEINVQTVTVEKTTFTSTTRLNGEITSDNSEVGILPDTAGIVTRVLVKRGDIVEKDQVIAYIDPSRPGQSYQESPVRSKADGMITSIPVSVGEYVTETSPIVTLSGDKTLYISANLPERYIGTLETGMKATFQSIAYPGETFSAQVTFISPNLSTTTRTAPIELAITSEQEELHEGMFVTLDLITEEEDDVIAVPSSAISDFIGESVVFVAEDGKARRVNVETGSSNGSLTVIESGLEEGDMVITAGTVTDGSAINILQ